MRLSRLLMTAMGGKAETIPFPTELFTGGDEVVLYTQTASAPNYAFRILQHIGDRKYWMMWWDYTATIGANGTWIKQDNIVNMYRALHDQTTPAVSFSGTWTVSSRTALSGYLRCTSGAGGYVQVTTSDSVTAVGCIIPAGLTNGMIHLVTIDGDNTLADLLPTAQDLVTAGTISDTALVANGGTLNPTDRMLDTYGRTAASAPFNQAAYQLFTTSLAAGQHTVKITMTAYFNAASTGGWWVTGFLLEHGASIPAISNNTAWPFMVNNTQVSPESRVNEISYNTTPTGGTGLEWIGHTNSFKWETLPSFVMDAIAITPAVRPFYYGSTLAISHKFNLRHSTTGTTNIGTLAVTYSLNKLTGLTLSHTLTWLSGGVTMGYPVMLQALHATMDRFATEDAPTGADLTADDDSFNFNSDGKIAYCWDADGYAAAMLYIPSLALTVNNWTETSTNKFAWADASAGTWKKAYATRIGPGTRAYLENEVFQAVANYRVGWFPSGANAALAGS